MPMSTYVEPELATRIGGDPWEVCWHEVDLMNKLIPYFTKHPRPNWTDHLGHVADGMQKVLLGVHYNMKDLVRVGMMDVKAGMDEIQAGCGAWKVAETDDCGTGQKWIWLQQILQWIHDHPKVPIPPNPPDPGPWYKELGEMMNGLHEVIILGAISDPKMRKVVLNPVLEKINVSVVRLQGLKM